MKIKTKFNIGDKFRWKKDFRDVTCTNETDIFRICGIKIEKEGLFYNYYKFPASKNRTWNKKFGYRSAAAEFAIEKI